MKKLISFLPPSDFLSIIFQIFSIILATDYIINNNQFEQTLYYISIFLVIVWFFSFINMVRLAKYNKVFIFIIFTALQLILASIFIHNNRHNNNKSLLKSNDIKNISTAVIFLSSYVIIGNLYINYKLKSWPLLKL
jgi:hypothetical protein